VKKTNCIALVIALASVTAIASEEVESKYYGSFPTEIGKKGCTVIADAPVTSASYYSSSKSPKEVTEFILSEQSKMESEVLGKGFNAIVGLRAEFSLSTSGGVVYFSGKAVKYECPIIM